MLSSSAAFRKVRVVLCRGNAVTRAKRSELSANHALEPSRNATAFCEDTWSSPMRALNAFATCLAGVRSGGSARSMALNFDSMRARSGSADLEL